MITIMGRHTGLGLLSTTSVSSRLPSLRKLSGTLLTIAKSDRVRSGAVLYGARWKRAGRFTRLIR